MIPLQQKIAILADAAKYDASCASSGAARRDSRRSGGIGSVENPGVCHSFLPDGRCISLLKLLLTNICIYDCGYCINRRSSGVERARFSVDEVADLTMAFYKRNYIEGLFLSSGVFKSPDDTMEQLVRVAETLRVEHRFRGYIHLKVIAEADPMLLLRAGRFADRLSANVELPEEGSLRRLAPQKEPGEIRAAMGRMREGIEEAAADTRAPHFAAGGQSTQMIVGADNSRDEAILHSSDVLYKDYALKRVYFSAFSPVTVADKALPLKPPDLVRENRLYQADWLMRFYEFQVSEILAGGEAGMLDREVDPKLAWALKHRERFPVDLNRADRHELLRVPGIGVRTVQKILRARRLSRLRLDDLTTLRVTKKSLPFVSVLDYRPKSAVLEGNNLRARFVAPQQYSLFGPDA